LHGGIDIFGQHVSRHTTKSVHITGQQIVNRNRAELVDIIDGTLLAETEPDLCGAIVTADWYQKPSRICAMKFDIKFPADIE